MRLQVIALVTSLLTAQSQGLGINCRGSSNCAGSSGTLASLTAEICNHNPLSDTKPPGEHFAQAKCGQFGGAKAVFVQSTSRSLSYGEVCDNLRKLQSHGCKGCGSVPINPGNDVKKGQVTVNYVAECRCTGGPDKCGVTKKRELAPEHELAPDDVLEPENVLAPENELAPEPDQSPAPVLFKRLGINCRGSSSCPGIRVNNKNLVNEICNADPKQTWGPGEHIATACQDFDTGLAAFTQKTSERITQPRACELAKRIRAHGCTKCGSVPFQGNNVAGGELTLNYVSSC